MSDSQIERVKQGNDIVSIIGERVTLKRAGRNFRGLCPFHGEKTPSFFVSPEMQLYKCFGCGAGGDVLAFMQAYEGMTFPEALEYLARKAGVTLVRVYRNDADKRKERLLEIMHLTGELYHFLLTKHGVGKAAREYLQKRGIVAQTINDYHLGYAPDSWQTLQGYLVGKKGYKTEEIIAAGLLVKNPNGRTYDRFRGRIMFPQYTANGKIVGFAGRLLAQVKEAKYINSPETEVYHKGEMLYGLAQARGAIRKANAVVVVEGEFDALSSVQAHVPETVAIKGSAFTKEQAILIKRLAATAILALDADAAGQEAILRAITVAEPMGMTLKVVEVVGGKDPDEVAQHNPLTWRKMVGGAISVYQFYLDLALRRFDAKTGLGQKEITKMTLPIFNKIENKVEQLFYVRKLAEALKVPERVIEEEMAKLKAGQKNEAETTDQRERQQKLTRREKLERYVIGVGLHVLDTMNVYWEEVNEAWFEESYLKQAVHKIKDQIKDKPKRPYNKLIESLEAESIPILQELYTEDMAWFEMQPQDLEKTALKAMNDLKNVAARAVIDDLGKKLIQEKDEEKLTELQQQYREGLRNYKHIDSS